MPKASGQSLKITRTSKPQAPWRPVKVFRPTEGPHHQPTPATPPTPSNATAAKAVNIAKHPPGIDPRQQHN